MSDVSIESIATVGAVLAFLLAAAAGITSRRGIQLIAIGLLFSWLPPVSRAAGMWMAGQRGSLSEVTHSESGGPIAVRKWIGDVSADRIGQVWRAEDHEALLRTMRAADDLTLALVALARREALDTVSQMNEREDLDGIRSTTEPVGASVRAHGD